MNWQPIDEKCTGVPQYENVLAYVTFPNEIMVRPVQMVAYCDDQGVWRACSIRVSGTVTHWMPLPPPPNNANGADGQSPQLSQDQFLLDI